MNRLHRFLFKPAPAGGLGRARALFYGGLFLGYGPGSDLSAWGAISPELWRPVFPYPALAGPPPEVWLRVLEVVFELCLAAAALGILFPVAGPGAFVLGWALLALPNQFGRAYHVDAPVVMLLGVLAFSRAADAWTLGSLFPRVSPGAGGKRLPRVPDPARTESAVGDAGENGSLLSLSGVERGDCQGRISRASVEQRECFSVDSGSRVEMGQSGENGCRLSGEYRWPVQAARVVLCLVFVSAGLSKLRNAGWEWLNPQAQGFLLLDRWVSSTPWTDWGLLLAAHPGWLVAGAAATLGLELLYPLALVSRRLRPWLAAGALGLLLGFKAVLGPAFVALAFCHLWWWPWERWGESREGA